jgi:hypothetical protein
MSPNDDTSDYVSPLLARLVLALMLTPFAILLSASAFALVASQGGEIVAVPVTAALVAAGGRGVAWWLAQLSQTHWQ